MNNINNSQPDGAVQKASLGNLSNGICLEPHFRAIQVKFTKEINEKQKEVTERLEIGQQEQHLLDALLGLVNFGTNEQGLELSADLQKKLNGIAQLGQEQFVDPKEIDLELENDNLNDKQRNDLIAEKNAAIKRIKAEASAVEMLNRMGFSFTVKAEGNDVNFNNLIADLERPENAEHPLKELFTKMGIDRNNPKPTPEQLKQITAAANKTHTASELSRETGEPVDLSKETDAEKQARIANQFANRAVRELLHAHNLLGRETKLDKRNADQVAHNIKGLIKEKESANGLDQKKSMALENQLNKMYEALITCAKKWSEAIEKMARAIKG